MVQSCFNNFRTQTKNDLYNKFKNNRTVVRAKKVAGNFTTIPHRILHDKRLSSDSKILLISTLSDADNFDFSRTGLINRIGISEYRLDEALKKLIEFGYISKTKVHAQYYHYKISEYGNLNKLGSKTSKLDEPVVPTESSKTVNEYHEMFKKIVMVKIDFIDDEWISGILGKIKSKSDYYTELSTLDKLINKAKATHYKTLEAYVNSGGASKHIKPKILKEIRDLITKEHKKISTDSVNRIRTRISQKFQQNKVKKYGFDYETQLVDRAENPLD